MLTSLYAKASAWWGAFRTRFQDDTGAVSTEYGLLLVLVALAIVAAATALGLAISGVFSDAGTELGGV